MTIQLNEDEFFHRASHFLLPRMGEGARLELDTDLLEPDGLDSLIMIEFFFFLEEQRGSPIDTEGFTIQSMATLRRAYQLVSKS